MTRIRSRSRWKKVGITSLVSIMVLFLIFMVLRENIHTVVPRQVYRSAQLSPSRLEALIRSKHIRTVINLRGSNADRRWYRDEVQVSRIMSIKHYDIRLSSTELPKPSQLRRLIHLFQTAPRPILLHCQGGADRTGFASSMFILLQGGSIAEARDAFSWVYHVKSPRSIGKLVLPHYVSWLKKNNLKTSRKNFLNWVGMATLSGPPS